MMASASFRRLLSALFLAGALASVASAQTTLTFTNDASGAWADGIAEDGDGGSPDLAGRTVRIYMISDTAGTFLNTPLNFDSVFFPFLASYAANGGSGETKGMAIATADGSEFKLNGFLYSNWGESGTVTIEVRGYRDTVEVASTSFVTTVINSYQTAAVNLGSSFGNVDEVRLFSAAATWHGLNDIVIAPAVPPPTVTDARIAISGATGSGGAYKIGDTVTATWNNTAGGDNNTGVTGVTMNFSPFGGGAALVATNSSGTWTATYTVTAGAIDNTNRNVSVTASNGSGSTTTADTTNATVDNIAPAVTSSTVFGSPASSDTSMSFLVAFNDDVNAVSVDDFTLSGTGSATGTIASVSAAFGTSVGVSITGISGNGTLKLNLNGSTNVVDNAGNGSPAAFTSGSTHTVAVPTAPGAPTIGTATAGDAQVSVTFTAPGNNGGSAITTYTATASPGGAFGTCAGPAACAITVSGLSNGTAYTFTVTATNAIGTSVASGASNSATPKGAQVITFANPGSQNFGTAPTLTATADSGLTVTFSSSTTGVCTITSGGALTFVAAGTCTIDADQAGNAATNAATTVSRSFTVNAVAPGAPTIGTATAGDTQASVTFTAPATSGGTAIVGYTVTASPGGATGSGAGSPIVVTGLTNGVAYTFTVTATNNAALTGSASAASNAVTPAAPQTITFTNPGAQNFGTTPTLSASSTSGLAVAFTSSSTGVCTVTSGGSLTFVSAGTCTINADQAGDSSFLPASQVSRSFTVNAVVPGAPTTVAATAGDTQASVAFSAPVFTGGSAITGYIVTANPPDVAPVNGAGSPMVVTGLTNGQAYTFTVTADNVAGTGPASAPSNSITPAATQTITFANPGAQNFGTTPTLTATADSGLTVTFSSSTSGVCTITSGGALSFVSSGTCTINADQAGDGSYLPATRVTRSFGVNAVVPGAPTGVAATAGDLQASVAFTAPAFTGGAAIASYTVTAAPGGATASGAASPITVSGLTNGASYTFTVTAANIAGTGAPSTASNAVTPAPAVPSVSIAVAPVSVSETGATALVFTVTRSQILGTATVVTLTPGGTATAGVDYTGGVATVTIPANAASATVTMAPIADALAEADETVSLGVATGAGYTVGAPSSAVGTITNETSAPAGPTQFRITAMSGNQVSLAWVLPTSGAAATGILLEGGMTPGATVGVAQVLTPAAGAVVTLPTGSYYLRLRLMTSDGLSAPSNEIPAHVNVPVAPSAPAFLLGGAEGDTVRLAWTPTFAGGAPAGAVIDVTGSATGAVSVGAGDTFTYPATPAGTYTFTVRQTNAAGASAPSAPVTIAVPASCPSTPQLPANVVAYATGGRVYLQWDPPVGGSVPSGYVVNVTGAYTGTLAVAGRSIDTPAPAGVYHLAVAAANACGAGTATAPQTVVVASSSPRLGPLAAPDAFATPYGTTLTVAAPALLANDTANSGDAMAASLVAAPAFGTITVTGGGGFTYTPRSGFSGTDTFSYRVTTFAGGPSAPALVSIAVGAAAGPRPPLGAADAYATTADGTLSVPAGQGLLVNDDALGGGGLSAQLTAAPSHGVLVLAADGGFTFTPAPGFSGADSFSYAPRTASGGLGDVTAVTLTVAGPGQPVPPSQLRIMGITGTQVSLAWVLPSAGPVPTGVVVEGGESPGSVVGVLAPIPVTSAATVTLPPGSFYLRARVMTAMGLSAPSNEVLVHADATRPPSAPTALLGAVDGTAVTLVWTPTFSGGPATGARVDVSGTATASVDVDAGGRFSYPTAPGGTYTFTVRHTNAAGVSAASAPVTVTVPGTCAVAPEPPLGVVAAWTGSQMLVQWDAPKAGPAPASYTVSVTGALAGSVTTVNRSVAAPLPPGTYAFAVAAANTCGVSAVTAAPPVTVP